MQAAADIHEARIETDVEDSSFIRTEDTVCLVCTSGDAMKRGYLAAKGFGSQQCHLEPEPRNEEPCEVWRCSFQLEDAMSVHAMYIHGLASWKKKPGSRKILMYGHAVLLRHCGTKKLLRCLKSSPTNDKMAYNVGFAEDTVGVDEDCWFIVHPASSQRSEGEKVRAGDDIFLVSVANERFLSAQMSFFQNAESDSSTFEQRLNSVQASFHQCVWVLHIVCSGSAKEAAIGNVNGCDVVRLIHRHWGNDVLTVATNECDMDVGKLPDKSTVDVRYEKLAENAELRSLWRVELFQMRFGGGFTSWCQPFRLCHVVTGKYLGVRCEGCEMGGLESSVTRKAKPKQIVTLFDPCEASKSATAFCFRKSSGKIPSWIEHHLKVEGMGTPEIQFGDSEVFLLHLKSGQLLGCPVSERRHRMMSGIRRAIMQAELHQSFAFTLTRASEEQAKAASNIQLSRDIMRNYVHKMLLTSEPVASGHLEEELMQVLSDFSSYFGVPNKSLLSHDDYQHQLCMLRERQNLFNKQGMLQFTMTVVVETAEKNSPKSKCIHHNLYKLLAAMIRGNHGNCRMFATSRWLKVFIEQLSVPSYTHDVLEVIQCLLDDSPEVLNIISPCDIRAIVNLLNTNGRDEKVMKLLSSLCVCHGVAMRDKQRLIYKHLLNSRNLLLQTSLHDHVNSVHPTVYVGHCNGSALYHKWYFEVQVTQLLPTKPSGSRSPHLRVGWAHASLFSPLPASNGSSTTGGGIGDDVFSVGFDGLHFWVGGFAITPQKVLHRQEENVPLHESTPLPVFSDQDRPLSVGDVIGCCLDLEKGEVSFLKNGHHVGGYLEFSHSKDMITPAVSFSAGVSVVLSLGGCHGKFCYNPPKSYSSLHEAVELNKEVELVPFRCLGAYSELLVTGPTVLTDFEAFIPAPIDISNVSLPDPITRGGLSDKLAKNIHEVWSKNKIENGFTYGEVRNDNLKHNPSLKPFEELSESEQSYDYNMALQTLKTLVSLGYQISTDEKSSFDVPYLELPPEKYQLSNGYIPRPLDLEAVDIPESLECLIEKLAENAHNIWAAERIKQNWTYGKADDSETKRNPLLIPYSKLNKTAKKSNYDTAYESVRTICALGCTLDPPAVCQGVSSIFQLAREFNANSHIKTRTFRGQLCYKLKEGKWYYEVKLSTAGMMRIGWATPSFQAGTVLGADEHSYAFDGFLARKWHKGSESFGRRWKVGDVIGCLLNMEDKTIAFSLNGEMLEDTFESAIAFDNIDTSNGLVPAITLSAGEEAHLNFGRNENALHSTYTSFKPVCSSRAKALHYNIPLWYSSHDGEYKVIDHTHPDLVAMQQDDSNSTIDIKFKDYDHIVTDHQCLRLNFGVTVSSSARPTLHPRPGPLSPVYEEINLKGFEDVLETQNEGKVSFSLIVPAGQDTHTTFVGWTTAGFRYIHSQFQRDESRSYDHTKYGQHMRVIGQRRTSTVSSSSYSSAFMVPLSQLLLPSINHLGIEARVTCTLDLVSGEMTFTCRTPESDWSTSEQVQLIASPGTKLFPTVILTMIQEHIITFDFSPAEGCKPLSSVLLSNLDTIDDCELYYTPEMPVCPPRMKIMALSTSQWLRQPPHKHIYTTSTMSTGAFQVNTNKKPCYCIYVTLPEEDRVIDILELSESYCLKDFHIQTLKAYIAVCSHSNLQLASSIAQFLDSEQLLQCLKIDGVRYELKFAYLKLFSALHLEHEVHTRLTMNGEFILPLSACKERVPLSSVDSDEEKEKRKPTSDQAAANITHNLTSTVSRLAYDVESEQSRLQQLKEMVFESLEDLLSTQYYIMKLLPSESRSQIFVPLIQTLDHLLVMGVVHGEEDYRRLLALLDPQLFAKENNRKFLVGLLSPEVTSEEPMKLALCSLLQHLCDCQVHHRVESVVTFAHQFVGNLQEEQEKKHKLFFMKCPKEFRCSPEKQLEAMLIKDSRREKSHERRGAREMELMKELRTFHEELKNHCGSYEDRLCAIQPLDVQDKLQKLFQLVTSLDDPHHHDNNETHTITLGELINKAMIDWAGKEIQDLELICEIFSVLFRQYNEGFEVAQALKKTYVIDVVNDNSGNPNYDIPKFHRALGCLRLLMKVGMGKTEENLLKDSLKTIHHSSLFYCHPHLLRQLGVHTTVLNLMKTYLGISSGSPENDLLSSRRRYRRDEKSSPVEACCKFLCKFAKISQENQRALFAHIGYLIQHASKCPDSLKSARYTPLDVATATIKDNLELGFALEECHLENVVQLLVATTTNMQQASDDGSPQEEPLGLGMIRHVSFSFNYEWNPRGGEKCLEFLHSAVWIENEQIQENANIIVRLLIHHSECMGPALAGDALGLHKVYSEVAEILAEPDKPPSPPQQHPQGINRNASTVSTVSTFSTASTFINGIETAQHVLSFYTALLRLLAHCAMLPGDGNSSTCTQRQRKNCAIRTRNILQNLIKTDDIIGILSLSYSKNGLTPTHKEVVLLFLERVYGTPNMEMVQTLIMSAFLNDVKMAIKYSENDSSFCSALNHYVCCSILPLLTSCATVFRQLLPYVVGGILSCSFHLACRSRLSHSKLDKIANFLIAVIRAIHPRVLQSYMPKIIADIPKLRPNVPILCKVLASTYEHFVNYYQSGMLDRTLLGFASEEEKTCTALVVYRLLDTLAKNTHALSDSLLLRSSVACLKAVSCALVPDCLIPDESILGLMHQATTADFEPTPTDISRITLTQEQESFVVKFATYLHDYWVQERHDEGWTCGTEYVVSKRTHPKLRPFHTLPQIEQEAAKKPIQDLLKFLNSKSWTLTKHRPMDANKIPKKRKLSCLRKPMKRAKSVIIPHTLEENKQYEPVVLDIRKIELKPETLIATEKMARDYHYRRAKELMTTNPDTYRKHPDFSPYDLLDEEKKENYRNYIMDLFRYLALEGWELTRGILINRTSSEEDSVAKERFSLQLFSRFQHLLSSEKLDVTFYVKVLFPLLTSYLSEHGGYFMPSESHRGHSFASREEKLKILQMFCQVNEFTRRNLDKLFPSIKKTPSGSATHSFLSPLDTSSNGVRPSSGSVGSGGGKGDKEKLSVSDSSWVAARCLLSLMQSMIKSMDIRGIANGAESFAKECPEMVDYFRQASSGIQLTAKNINKLNKLDARFHFYTVNLLIPSLSCLFKHAGANNAGQCLIDGPIQTHCRYIFQNLVEMAAGNEPVFVGSSSLVTIGRCMGAFALAYPDCFLDNGQFGFPLSTLLEQLHNATNPTATAGNVVFVVDIIIPVLSSYISSWWRDDAAVDPNVHIITTSQVDDILGEVLSLMAMHFGIKNIQWFYRIIESCVLLASKCSLNLLQSHLIPIMAEMRERAIGLWQDEQYLLATWTQSMDVDTQKEALVEDYHIFVRDLITILPILTIVIHSNSEALRNTPGIYKDAYTLFSSVADIFHCWSSSQHFKREYQTARHQLTKLLTQIDSYAAVKTLTARLIRIKTFQKSGPNVPNLLLVCLELLLPASDQQLSPADRELVEACQKKLGQKGILCEDLNMEIKNELEARQNMAPMQSHVHQFVRSISIRFIPPAKTIDERALQILSLARVKYKIAQVEKGQAAQRRWKHIFSQRKKKAIINCFLAVPYFKLSKHRAVNIFLQHYCSNWLLQDEHAEHRHLTTELLDKQDYLAVQRREAAKKLPPESRGKEVVHLDPLSQLFTMFKRTASAQECLNEELFISFADVLSKSVLGHSEEEEMTAEDNPTKAYELYSEEKAELMVKQGQLAERGASKMVLLIISATEGVMCPVVHSTLKLGIALLKEGNQKIQGEMLQKLKSMDVGFLNGIAKLISCCSVLDWNTYERFNKSELAQTTNGADSVCKVLHDSSFTVSLFRFLQLLCEGHNANFQNYLRTQAGNTTTVNIIISTVDYLLRLQESISDFHWHYTDYDVIDLPGRECFLKAFKVAKQVFRTLTEYIQGPCVKNQEALSRSRLWDAVSGFLYIFAVLQRKLYKDTSQMELLRELLRLQEEMFILLLSMLEGSAMSSTIGKLMVNTLMESIHHIEDIMQFFSIFVKLKDSTTSKAFMEYDLNKDGLISYREFEMAMEAQQRYTKEEIAYLMECADLNNDGLLDYMEFSERFHQPAESIGFHLCVLIVHLSDHLPDDKRLQCFKRMPQGRELMEHFAKSMGCIEILGKSGKIERVYFEVKKERLQQWEEAQIQESRRNFLHSVELGSQKNKLQGFMSFCEDTIFEIDYADKISATEQTAMEARAKMHMTKHNRMLHRPTQPFISRVKDRMTAFQHHHTSAQKLITWLLALWTLLIHRVWPAVRKTATTMKQKVRSARTTLHRKLFVSPSSPPKLSSKMKQPSLRKKRPGLKLVLNPTDDSPRSSEKTGRVPRPSPQSASIIDSGISSGKDTRNKSLYPSTNGHGGTLGPPKYMRGVSEDINRRGSVYTPRHGTARQLTLTYDRSKMKPPAEVSTVTTTPSSVTETDSLQSAGNGGDSYIPKITMTSASFSSMLARHYYRLNNLKLSVTFFINVMLLTFKVNTAFNVPVEEPSNESLHLELGDPFWSPIMLHFLSLSHFFLSAILIVSYMYLKVPLIIFKKEKYVAHQLERKQLWINNNRPGTYSDWWDSLVVGSYSFPRKYWDKQVKQRVVEQICCGEESKKHVARQLGIETKSRFEKRTQWDMITEILHSLVDIRYCVWAVGVTLSDMMILYNMLYCCLSFMGLRWNSFYFSVHLLDLVMNFKLLKTVLRSVLHNGKQLAMTVLMTAVVIYIYTVIAFNFFRKFYNKSDGPNCDSMFRCFIYHIDQGLRSGGGIADVLAPASGDPSEFLRLCFDISFFFFVIVILLAIIQGLIIDAFGELRDKEETLTAEMQTKCFVCGLQKSNFDHIPHGFDDHINREHNVAHYMFFLLYLIKKKESEFSGQESYVWEMYLKQKWDFFPVGDCFQAQEGRSGAAGRAHSGQWKTHHSSPAALRKQMTSSTNLQQFNNNGHHNNY